MSQMFGYVTKSNSPKSPAATSIEDVAEIKSEVKKLTSKYKVWEWSSIDSFEDMRRTDPSAKFVMLRLLQGFKRAEDEQRAFVKACTVALGNQVFCYHDEIVLEEEWLYVCPISIEASRTPDAHALSVITGENEMVITECAYAQAPIKSHENVWYNIPEPLLPTEKERKYKQPVCRAEGSLYGLGSRKA